MYGQILTLVFNPRIEFLNKAQIYVKIHQLSKNLGSVIAERGFPKVADWLTGQ